MKLLSIGELKETGIPYSRAHIYRLIHAKKFPEPVRLGEIASPLLRARCWTGSPARSQSATPSWRSHEMAPPHKRNPSLLGGHEVKTIWQCSGDRPTLSATPAFRRSQQASHPSSHQATARGDRCHALARMVGTRNRFLPLSLRGRVQARGINLNMKTNRRRNYA